MPQITYGMGTIARTSKQQKQKKGIMVSYKVPVRARGLGITSLVFGILGGAFFWWTPLGMVLSLTGLLLGFITWTAARRHTQAFGLAIAGMLVALVALILDSVVAGLGLELVKFHALR